MSAIRKSFPVLAAFEILSGTSLAGQNDYYLSVPLQHAIMRVDATTLTATPFATFVNHPFYGYFDAAGNFLVPDHLLSSVLKIDPNGNGSVVTFGGFLTSPLATIKDRNSNDIIATDLFQHTVVRVDANGSQTLIHDALTSNGLLYGPGGLQFDDAGNLYVANNTGSTILKIDRQSNISLFSASPLIKTPGAIAIDGAGNMFVPMYDGNTIVRFRLDTAEAEIFAQDPALMIRPNDLKFSRGGRLLTTTRLSNLLEIDALGNITELFKQPGWADILGVAVPADAQSCTGRFIEYGTGLAGTAGIVPKLRALFAPCPGERVGIEFRDFLGGTSAIVAFGFASANVPAFGGSLLVDLAPPGSIVLLGFPGNGAGEGDLTIQFTLDANPGFVGLSLFMQTLATDPGSPVGVSLSNGLEMRIGS